MTRLLILAALTAPLLLAQGAVAQQDLGSRYGYADMDISCSPAARQPFTRGLLQLHSFAWADARHSFAEATRTDPGCAMAYWGIAMTRYDSLHEAPPPEEVAAARAELAQALTAPTRSARETAYIRAAGELFRDAERVPRIERDRNYSEALAAIAARWPEDEEAQIFHALSLLALARRGESPALTGQAAAILEPLFERFPEHPGIAHYLIHAYDDAGNREPGLAAARRYAGIAPLMTHAQHMPSHIFAGLGLWQESNASNDTALEADPRYYHSLMYVVYGHLQLGQWAEARRRFAALAEFAASPDGGGRERRGLHQVNTWLLLETRDWPAAAAAPMYSDRPLDVAETIYVRGLGAAHTGDVAKATGAADSLEQLLGEFDTIDDAGLASRTLLTRIQVLVIRAMIESARGQPLAAIDLLREAAALERLPELNRAPPDSGTGIPAQELLGEVLFASGRFDEATAAFESALERTPRRLHSMSGLARSAARAGKADAARAHYRALLALLAGADADLPHAVEARQYLAADPT